MSARPVLATDALVRDPYGSHEMPIYQTSTFTFERTADAAALFAGERAGFVYTRIGNPTVAQWERRVAELETAGTGIEAGALAFASGMGAISASVLAAVSAGDHVAAMEPLYGGTDELFGEVLPRYEVGVTRVAADDWAGFERAIARPNTRVVFIETPGNPTLDVVDIARAARLAHDAGALLYVDNTFATPVLQQPLAFGADVVLQSSTKYLGGHGAVVGGAVIAPDLAFLAGPVMQMRKVLGACAAPQDAWLLFQGAKTLELRVERSTRTAGLLARALAGHEMVEWLRYPGLPADPGYETARRQMRGFGGMIAFGIRGGAEAGAAFMDALLVAKRAVSLGATDTLIEQPATMTHAHLSPEDRARAGITDGLIRVSVGLEPADELEADLLKALAAAAAKGLVAAQR
jgi:methionine-gamma-lyase